MNGMYGFYDRYVCVWCFVIRHGAFVMCMTIPFFVEAEYAEEAYILRIY